MKRIPFLLIAVIFSSLAYGQTRPNIVFVLSDDHAYQAFSAYGYGINHTPNIDKLASEAFCSEMLL